MQTHIDLSVAEETAWLTLRTEPEGKPPALDYETLDEFERRLREIRHRGEEARAVVVQSYSEKYFCVGANLNVLRELDKDAIRSWVGRGHEVFAQLQSLPLPVIAVVAGHVAGGGLELALGCDFIFASDSARFAFPEAGLGFIPGWGGSFRLPKTVGPAFAKEMMFTGRTIDAEEAFRIGLVNYYASAEGRDERLAEVLGAIRQNSAISIAMIKQLVNEASAPRLERMRFSESTASTTAMSSGDTAKRLENFFASRKKK